MTRESRKQRSIYILSFGLVSALSALASLGSWQLYRIVQGMNQISQPVSHESLIAQGQAPKSEEAAEVPTQNPPPELAERSIASLIPSPNGPHFRKFRGGGGAIEAPANPPMPEDGAQPGAQTEEEIAGNEASAQTYQELQDAAAMASPGTAEYDEVLQENDPAIQQNFQTAQVNSALMAGQPSYPPENLSQNDPSLSVPNQDTQPPMQPPYYPFQRRK